MALRPDLSIVVPCYNEEETLPHTLAALLPALEALTSGSWEVVLVDDGSGDATLALIADAHLRDPRVKGVGLSRNFGHQNALTTGLAFASGECVGVIDADLQDPIDVLADLYRKVAAGGCDVCIGVRRRRDAAWWLRFGYWLFYQSIGRLAVPPWPRDAGDFCVFSRRVHEVLLALPERARTLRGLRSWVGFRQASVPYDRPARQHGSSKYSLMRLFNLALDSFVSFTHAPLRLASLSAVGMSLATLAIAAVFLVNRLVPSVSIFGYWIGANPGVTTVVLYLSFIASVLFLCLGIIGEYLYLLLRETQGRPTAVVDTLLGASPTSLTARTVGTSLISPSPSTAPRP